MNFNGIPQDLHYAFPEASYALFVVLFLAFLFWIYFLYRKNTLHLFSSKENLPKLLIKRPKSLYFFKALCFCLAWILAVFALMQPKVNGHYPEIIAKTKNDPLMPKLKAHDIIFLIDASLSMNVQESSSGKTRLDLAKEIADEILSQLNGEAAALYAFTSVPTKMSPATLDLFFVRMMLRDISINEGGVAGTDFLKALQVINQNHFKEQKDKLTTLIILSDGGDTSLHILRGDDLKIRINAIAGEIKDPKALNLRVFTIGLGSNEEELIPEVSYLQKPVYTKLESGLLKLLSENGRGAYYEANAITPLQIAKSLIKAMQEDDPYLKNDDSQDPKELLVYELAFQIPLGIAILLLAFYLFFPNISIFSTTLSLLLCLQTPGFCALKDEMQLAKNYYEAGNLKKADELYEKMLNEKLDPFEKAVILYNQGTLFLNDDNLKSAIDTYESINLKGNPPLFLIYRIKKNLSISKYRQALKILSSEDIDENLIEKAIYLLEASQKQLEIAEKAECDLQMKMGRSSCETLSDLSKLKSSIQHKLTDAMKRLNRPLLKETTDEQFMKKIALIDDKAMKLKPQNIHELNELLKLAIEASHETLARTRTTIQEGSEKDVKILENAQKVVLKIAESYFKTSYSIQADEYQKNGKLKKPWNEILPLYHKGYEAAVDALNIFPKDLEESSSKQEEAIKYWKLEKKNQEKKPEQNKKPKPEEEPKPEEKQKDLSEKALQLLQDMQLGDKKQKAYPKSSKQEVERPW